MDKEIQPWNQHKFYAKFVPGKSGSESNERTIASSFNPNNSIGALQPENPADRTPTDAQDPDRDVSADSDETIDPDEQIEQATHDSILLEQLVDQVPGASSTPYKACDAANVTLPDGGYTCVSALILQLMIQ